ncbi:MAG: hypothetical protein KDC71_23680, partial [Acidobacteria bacterium]|nr:hypothetical protein [Acidobacteriota bacterium]
MQLNLSEAHKILGDFGEIHHSHLPPGVYDQVNEYKSRFASKFKSTHITNLASMQGNTYYASLKLDGEHAHLWWDDQYEIPMLVRHRGYAYFGLPILEKAAAILRKKGIKKALIPGELYVRKPDYERTRVFDVISLTKAPKSQTDLEMLSFAPFDILELDGQYFDDFGEVWQAILALFQGTEIEPPPMLITKDKTEILTYFERWVNEYNAEGLMVRSDLTFRYKLKAKFTIDAAILGYTEDQGKVTSLLTGLMHNDGQYQVCAHVYKRIPDDLAVSLYKQLSKRHVPSEYYEMSSFYVPFHMVKPETVIEFSTTDMVPERSNGMPVKKAVLDYEKKEGYTLTKTSPFANLAHCEFVRIREDKAPNP